MSADRPPFDEDIRGWLRSRAEDPTAADTSPAAPGSTP
jgi:hypothetical protein